jgi:hypothetical protein
LFWKPSFIRAYKDEPETKTNLEYYLKEPHGCHQKPSLIPAAVFRWLWLLVLLSSSTTGKPPARWGTIYIDFAGKKFSYIDKETGELVECQVFIACLPYDYSFGIAVAIDRRLSLCLVLLFKHLGGVPQAVVPDNLKAVIKASRYEISTGLWKTLPTIMEPQFARKSQKATGQSPGRKPGETDL